MYLHQAIILIQRYNNTAMKIKKSKILYRLSLLALTVIVLGILLSIIKIYADSEPGAIPLLLIVGGTAGYIISRVQMRSQNSM